MKQIHEWDVRCSKRIQAWFSGRRGPAYIDKWHKWFWEQASAKGASVYAVVMLGLLFLLRDHRVFIWLIPVAVTAVLTVLLQAIIQRPRPRRGETKTHYKPILPTYSFPSNHAASSFAFATSLSYAFASSSLSVIWPFIMLFFFLAVVISLSRIVVGVHYCLDVLAGAMFGMSVTILLFGL